MTAPAWTRAIQKAGWALLCLFVFSIPWEKSVWVPGVGTIARLLGMTAFLLIALAATGRRSLRPPNLVLVFAAAFVCWTAATRFWSLAPGATDARAWTFVQLLVMAWMIWETCRTRERQNVLMSAYVWGTIPASVSTLLRYWRDEQTYYRRYAAAGFDPNDLGLTLALAIPMALYLGLPSRGFRRWCTYTAAALAICAILLTASRSALIASLIGFAYAALTWRRSQRAHRLASALLLALLVLGAIWLAPVHSRQRLATLPAELTEGTLHKRTRIWKAGLKAFKRHPFIGVGSGAYPQAVRPWLGTPPLTGHEYVAHNTFLSVLVECGVIGLGWFALLAATLVVFVWMLRAPERVLWFVMLAVWAAGVSTLTWEHRKPTWLLFALTTTCWELSFRPEEERA